MTILRFHWYESGAGRTGGRVSLSCQQRVFVSTRLAKRDERLSNFPTSTNNRLISEPSGWDEMLSVKREVGKAGGHLRSDRTPTRKKRLFSPDRYKVLSRVDDMTSVWMFLSGLSKVHRSNLFRITSNLITERRFRYCGSARSARSWHIFGRDDDTCAGRDRR